MTKQTSRKHGLAGIGLLLATCMPLAAQASSTFFFPLTDYCWEVSEPGVPDPATLQLRFKFLGGGNYLVAGAVLEAGSAFPINGNAIMDGSTIRMTTLVSGFEEDGGTLFTSNGVATVELDAHTRDGDLKGIQIGTIDDGTSITRIQEPIAGDLIYIGAGPACN